MGERVNPSRAEIFTYIDNINNINIIIINKSNSNISNVSAIITSNVAVLADGVVLALEGVASPFERGFFLLELVAFPPLPLRHAAPRPRTIRVIKAFKFPHPEGRWGTAHPPAAKGKDGGKGDAPRGRANNNINNTNNNNNNTKNNINNNNSISNNIHNINNINHIAQGRARQPFKSGDLHLKG